MSSFYIDGINGEYLGQNLGYWNGWSCPLFSESEATRLMDELNSGDYGMTVTFNNETKTFSVYDDNADEVSFYNELSKGDGLMGYAIGAYGWCWSQV